MTDTSTWSRRAKADYAYNYALDGFPRLKDAPDHLYTRLYFFALRFGVRVRKLGRPWRVFAEGWRNGKEYE